MRNVDFEDFALLPVCTLYVRADGLGPPISLQNQPTDGYFKALYYFIA